MIALQSGKININQFNTFWGDPLLVTVAARSVAFWVARSFFHFSSTFLYCWVGQMKIHTYIYIFIFWGGSKATTVLGAIEAISICHFFLNPLEGYHQCWAQNNSLKGWQIRNAKLLLNERGCLRKDKEKDGKEEKEEVTLKLPKPKDDARAKWHPWLLRFMEAGLPSYPRLKCWSFSSVRTCKNTKWTQQKPASLTLKTSSAEQKTEDSSLQSQCLEGFHGWVPPALRCDDLSDDVGCRISAFERIGVMCQPLFFVGFLSWVALGWGFVFCQGVRFRQFEIQSFKVVWFQCIGCGAADIFWNLRSFWHDNLYS